MDKIGKVNGTNVIMQVPLEMWVQEIAEKAGQAAAEKVIATHEKKCGVEGRVVEIETLKTKINRLELRLSVLVAFMVGSGVLGGGVVGLILKM